MDRVLHGICAAILCLCVTSGQAFAQSNAEKAYTPYFHWLDETRVRLAKTYQQLSPISFAVKSQKIFFENGEFTVSPYWADPEFTRGRKKAIANFEQVKKSVSGDHFTISPDDPNAGSKQFIVDLLDVYLNAMRVASVYIEPLMVEEDQQPKIPIAGYYEILAWMHRGEIALNMALLKGSAEVASEAIGPNVYADVIVQGANTALFSRYFAHTCIVVALSGGSEEQFDSYLQAANEAFNDSVDLFNEYSRWTEATYADNTSMRESHYWVLQHWDELLTSTEFLVDGLEEKPFNPSLLRKAKEGEAVMVDAGKWVPDDQKIWSFQNIITEMPKLIGRDAGLVPR